MAYFNDIGSHWSNLSTSWDPLKQTQEHQHGKAKSTCYFSALICWKGSLKDSTFFQIQIARRKAVCLKEQTACVVSCFHLLGDFLPFLFPYFRFFTYISKLQQLQLHQFSYQKASQRWTQMRKPFAQRCHRPNLSRLFQRHTEEQSVPPTSYVLIYIPEIQRFSWNRAPN